jgi:hypothetical protein
MLIGYSKLVGRYHHEFRLGPQELLIMRCANDSDRPWQPLEARAMFGSLRSDPVLRESVV